MSEEKKDKVIYLKDYTVPPYEVESYELNFDLYEDETLVTTSAKYYENINYSWNKELILNWEDVELVSIFLDEKELSETDYTLWENILTLADLPKEFELKIVTKIHPEKNTSLEWLYKSSWMYCTQCESHGFRRMTYFQDRPDVMTMFTVRITGDKELYPVLLSNGNKIEEGDLDNGRHFAIWKDPFKKPCYLFALVAGNLEFIEDTFTTMSGKEVVLRIFTESHNLHKCPFAMTSLKKSMVWDEQRYGLEYDLDIFMIVAVDDFNSGAMENKGLNIFNSACIFATPETATDRDFIRVEKVIAHEYFHNWTGDRVTCRDWFQLSLKEWLTVYRDHEFTSDTHSRSVARIESVKALRNYQFREDASPMAHSIRPVSFEEISNFYTSTVYEKWSEVIWIYEAILWRDGFRKWMDLYFERHDGEAVTTEDFLAAMRDANEDYLEKKWISLNQMQNWYNQAWTPVVDVVSHYDETTKIYTLFFRQHCPDTPETPAWKKKPFLIPIKYSLFDRNTNTDSWEQLLVLQEAEQKLEFKNVETKPIPSLLRTFSAPIKLNYAYSPADYLFLVENETDDFNRFEALQNFSKQVLLEHIHEWRSDHTQELLQGFKSILENDSLDNSFKAEALILPSEWEITDIIWKDVNPQHIHKIRDALEKQIAQSFEAEWKQTYQELSLTHPLSGTSLKSNGREQEEYNISTTSVGNRKLKNLSLKYITIATGDNVLAYKQFSAATNMTDEMWALQCVILVNNDTRKQALDDFYTKWKDDANVMDKWFSLQSTSPLEGVFEDIKNLVNHELFEMTNPNKVRSIFNAFAMLNPYHFHREDGKGYEFIADKVIELNKLNPMIASRLVKSMINWRGLEPVRSKLLKSQLERVNQEKLSPDVWEVVRKSLED